jgi:hypothetical protein
MSFVLRPPDEVVPLNRRLRAIGQARKYTRVAAGVGTLVAFAAFAFTCFGTLDSSLHLAAGLRAAALLALLGAGGALFQYGIRRPMRTSSEPVAVAMLVESRHAEFRDLLASAAAFQDWPANDARSAPRFREAAIRRAERLANRHDFADVVPKGRLWRAIALALTAVLVLGAWVVADPDRAAVAGARFVDPFGDHPWPPKTILEIQSPIASPYLHAKGNPLALRLRVRGAIPAEATLTVRLDGGLPFDESIPLAVEASADRVFEYAIPPDRIPRDFEYRVVANDADTGWRSVSVAAPPRLTLLDGRPSPQIRLIARAYTNEPPADRPEGTGSVEAVCGTRIVLRAATDRPIVAASLHFDGDRGGWNTAVAVAPLASAWPFAAAASPGLAESFGADIPVGVAGPDRRLLFADFETRLAGLYSLRFTDEAGLIGIQKLDIQTFPDPRPVVALLRPAPALDPLMLVPTAIVPVRVRADDRTFALRSHWLEYRVNDDPYTRVPLADAAAAERALPAVAGALGHHRRQRPHELESIRSIPLAAFRKSDGTRPTDGDTIVLRGAADDWDDYTLAKRPGTSAEVAIRVYSADGLTAHLQKELALLRPDIERAKAQQQAAAAKTDAAHAAATPDNRLPNEGRVQLARAEQDQRIVRGQVSDPAEGPRAKVEKLREIARANGLRDTPAARRADAVARILAELEDKHFAEIEPQLAAAQAAAQAEPGTTARGVREPLAKAAKEQKGAIEKLAAAAEELEQWAASAEVRGDVRQLKDQVARAAGESKTATDRLPAGTAPDRLPNADRTALEKTAEGLNKAAEQANKLLSKADRVAEQRRADAAKADAASNAKAAEAKQFEQAARAAAAGSPERAVAEAKASAAKADAAALAAAAAKARTEAEQLEKAAKDAGRQAIADELRAAADAQRNNRAGEAQAGAAKALDRLDRMTAGLAERRDDVDELAKKRKDAADRVDQIADQQDELAKKAAKANENPDAAGRADELRKLADEQETLRRETERLSRQLDREGAPDAAEQLRRAAEEMEQARDDLAEGRDPKANPDEALERLERAKDQLDKDRPQEKIQLEREQREEFVKQFRVFLEKQRAAVAESERLTAAAAKAKKWERPLQASLASLGDRQKAMAKEIRQFADDKTKELKVFDAMLREAADQMDRAAERIAERKADIVLADPAVFDAESEAAADETARRPMRTALRRLEQIVNSLQDDPKKAAAKPMPMGGAEAPMPMPMEGGMGGAAPGAPPVAQLKALRDWQKEVNERTAAFAKDHPNRDALTDDDKDELREIEDAQKSIKSLLDDLLPMLQPMAGGGIP